MREYKTESGNTVRDYSRVEHKYFIKKMQLTIEELIGIILDSGFQPVGNSIKCYYRGSEKIEIDTLNLKYYINGKLNKEFKGESLQKSSDFLFSL